MSVIPMGRSAWASPGMVALDLRSQRNRIAITARDMMGLGLPQDPSVAAAVGCAAGQAPGLVPGVCYPAGFPATTLTLGDSQVAGLSNAAARVAIRNFFIGRPRTAAELSALLKTWADGAWNSWVAEQAAHGRVTVAVDEVLRFYLSSKADMHERFLPRWQTQIDDLRHRWDARWPAYQALTLHLEALPPGPASAEAHAEVKRQVAAFAGLAEAIKADLAQTETTLREIIAERERSGSFAVMLREAVGIVTTIAADAVRWTVVNVAAPIVGGLLSGLPWWAFGLGAAWLYYGPVGRGLRR